MTPTNLVSMFGRLTLQRIPHSATYDEYLKTVVRVTTEFEQAMTDARQTMNAVGLRRAAATAAAKAAKDLVQLRENAGRRGLRDNIKNTRSTLFAEAHPAAASGQGDVERVERRRAILDQCRGLKPHERDLLFQGTSDAEVFEALKTAPPVIRMDRLKGPISEPMVSPEVLKAVTESRARAAKPEIAKTLDDLEVLDEAIENLIERAGSAISQATGLRAGSGLSDLVALSTAPDPGAAPVL